MRAHKSLKYGAILLGLAAAAAGAGALLLARANGRVRDEVGARLAQALHAECRVVAARVLSPRRFELRGLGCVMDEGPLLGFGAARAEAEFPRPPLAGALPPLRRLEVAGLELRLRDPLGALLSAGGGDEDDSAAAQAVLAEGSGGGRAGDDESGDDSAADAPTDIDASRLLEREALRFLSLSRALAEGRGGGGIPPLLARLEDGAAIAVDGAALSLADGSPLARSVHARLERQGDALLLAVAAEAATGGVTSFDGALSATGLSGARIELHRVPVAEALHALLAGPAAQIQAGTLSGALRWRDGEAGGTWAVDVGFEGLRVLDEKFGKEPLPFPTLRLAGTLFADAGAGRLRIDDGGGSLGGVPGRFRLDLGPLGDPAAEARARLDVRSEGMPLGELLLALPDSLMPKDWAREVQGTMDLDFWLEGPLHERTLWELDWEADFSRMSLAEGSLYSEVERLREPFPHEFQVLGDDGSLGDPIVRVIGAESGHFVPLHSISPVLVDAVLSSEDAGFFGHPGFEETEIKLALLENLRQGEGRGGSTITQQLAKNLFLSGERTLARKLKEAIVAWRLESALPKSRILEIYLNIAEWGPGLWGVRDAADHWFAKSPGALRAEEAAFLASLLPAPRRYHGYYHKPGGLTENRRAYVDDILSTMERLGRLTPEAAAEAKASAIELAPCGR